MFISTSEFSKMCNSKEFLPVTTFSNIVVPLSLCLDQSEHKRTENNITLFPIYVKHWPT